MRIAAPLAVLFSFSFGCAHGNTIEKVDVDTYRITCPEQSLDRCLGEAANNACDKRAYFVARGISEVNPRGRSEAPDEAPSSEAVVRCASGHAWGERGKELMAGSPSASAQPPTAPSAVAPSPPRAAALICAPGSTQSCFGSAGCHGGQACKADGSGYDVCDCGPTAPASTVDGG